MDSEEIVGLTDEEITDATRYDVGAQITLSRKERLRFMLYLVAYDVCDDKRLRHVAKVCVDYGVRIEKSVFECDLSHVDFERMWERLREKMDHDEDSIIAYRICSSCAQTVRSMGQVFRPGRRLCYVL